MYEEFPKTSEASLTSSFQLATNASFHQKASTESGHDLYVQVMSHTDIRENETAA